MEVSIIAGEMPTIKGTGAFKISFILEGRIGITACSHRKGYNNAVNA